jgi:cytochrome c oxidase subunit I
MVSVAILSGMLGSGGWTQYPPLGYEDESAYLSVVVSAILGSNCTEEAGVGVGSYGGAIDNRLLFTQASRIVGFFVGAVSMTLFVLSLLLLLDSAVDLNIFTYPTGNVQLFKETFWVFGHPEVYALVLPAIVFMNFIRNVLKFRWTPPLLAGRLHARSLYIGRVFFLSTLVWGHHLFTSMLSPVL